MNKITVDARMFNSSGIGTVIQNVLKKIIPQNKDLFFYIIGDPVKLAVQGLEHYENVRVIPCTVPIYSIKEQLTIPKLVPADSQLLWVPHYNIPIFYSGRLLVTVHDVFHLAMPQFVGGVLKKTYAHLLFGKVAINASKIICVSKFTAQEFQRLVGVDSRKLQVVYNGVDDFWSQPLENTQRIYKKPYILYVGNVKPHKNLVRLIKAFQIIMNRIPHNLVIVGKKEGFITGDAEVARLAGTLRDRVIFTGYIENPDLKNYYAYADAFVFPTLYEGFGLPPLEAMASGCKHILCSDIPVLHEIYDDAVTYFNSYDISNMGDVLMRELDNMESITYNRQAILNKYNWNSTVEGYKQAIRELL